jgi:ATP-dependent phosphofructokinase / diphosphate-dependent phosphofructokinase
MTATLSTEERQLDGRLLSMRIGMLTGGGDCPGLNAVIRAAVTKGIQAYGHEFVGFRDGWKGPLEGLTRPLGLEDVAGILAQGGTILGSSRTNPYKVDGGLDRIRTNIQDAGIDALIAIGGEDTLGVAKKLTDDGLGVVGVPKTIDNDLSATDYTFGFDTAVMIATESIDRVRTTAQSHHRALVVEVMGRHAGWIALHAGMAGGANVILLPEREFDIEQVAAQVRSCFDRGVAPIVVTSEGALPLGGEIDAFGHIRLGGIADWLAGEIEKRTGIEARSVILGHLQRGGSPTAYDRVLSTRFGLQAADAVNDKDFGKMVALHGTDIVRVSLAEAVGTLKTVPLERLTEAEVFFG